LSCSTVKCKQHAEVFVGMQRICCMPFLLPFQKRQWSNKAYDKRPAGHVGRRSVSIWRLVSMPWHLWQTRSRVHYYDIGLAVPAGCLGANQLCHLSGLASICSNSTSGSKQQQLFCSASAHHPYSSDLCWRCQLSRPCTNLPSPCQSVAAAGAAHTCLDPGFSHLLV